MALAMGVRGPFVILARQPALSIHSEVAHVAEDFYWGPTSRAT